MINANEILGSMNAEKLQALLALGILLIIECLSLWHNSRANYDVIGLLMKKNRISDEKTDVFVERHIGEDIKEQTSAYSKCRIYFCLFLFCVWGLALGLYKNDGISDYYILAFTMTVSFIEYRDNKRLSNKMKQANDWKIAECISDLKSEDCFSQFVLSCNEVSRSRKRKVSIYVDGVKHNRSVRISAAENVIRFVQMDKKHMPDGIPDVYRKGEATFFFDSGFSKFIIEDFAYNGAARIEIPII